MPGPAAPPVAASRSHRPAERDDDVGLRGLESGGAMQSRW